MAPDCCAAAAALDAAGTCPVDALQARLTRTRGVPLPALSPAAPQLGHAPCAFDCAASAALATESCQDPVLVLAEDAWIRLGPDSTNARLPEDWDLGELLEALGRRTSPARIEGADLVIGEDTFSLREWSIRPYILQFSEPVNSRPLDVRLLDIQRWEVDFSGAQEVRFAAADLCRVGHSATVIRAVIGLSGEHLVSARQALIDAVADADLVGMRVHFDETFAAEIKAPTLFIVSTQYGRQPPAGHYDQVADGGRRHEIVGLVDALARGFDPPEHVREPVRAAFCEPRLYWPAMTCLDLESGQRRIFPRHLMVTARGCPYSAPIPDILPPEEGEEDPLFTSRGCSFCPMGGDYRPSVPRYLDFLVDQLIWLAERDPGGDMVLADEAAFTFLGPLLERIATREARPGRLLIKARLNGLLENRERFGAALDVARDANLEIVCYLLGIENFSDAELRRYNKGITGEQLASGLRWLLELEDQYRGTFSATRHSSHGFILYNPWTTPADLRENLRRFREVEIWRFAGKAVWSRLRMHRWQPLYRSARAEGLLGETEHFARVVRQQLGYSAGEVPWRFADPASELVYVLVTRCIEALGATGEQPVDILEAALDEVAAHPPAAPVPLLEAEARAKKLTERLQRRAWPASVLRQRLAPIAPGVAVARGVFLESIDDGEIVLAVGGDRFPARVLARQGTVPGLVLERAPAGHEERRQLKVAVSRLRKLLGRR